MPRNGLLVKKEMILNQGDCSSFVRHSMFICFIFYAMRNLQKATDCMYRNCSHEIVYLHIERMTNAHVDWLEPNRF